MCVSGSGITSEEEAVSNGDLLGEERAGSLKASSKKKESTFFGSLSTFDLDGE